MTRIMQKIEKLKQENHATKKRENWGRRDDDSSRNEGVKNKKNPSKSKTPNHIPDRY